MRELQLLEVARTQQGDLTKSAVAGNHVGGNALVARESESVAAKRVEERAPVRIERFRGGLRAPGHSSPRGSSRR